MPTNTNLSRLALVVQKDLIELEKGDDTQLAQASRLLGTLCDVRVSTGLPAQLTDPIIQSAIEAITLRGSLRRSVVAQHEQLGEFARLLNLVVADGGYPKQPVPLMVKTDTAPADPHLIEA